MVNRIKLVCSLLLSLLLLTVLLLAGGCGSTAKTVTDAQIDDYNKAGNVYIVTTWTADVNIPTIDFDTTALGQWVGGEVAAKRVANDTDAVVAAALSELIDHPERYLFATGQTTSQSMDSSIGGNGFIINPDGDILTAAHMVKQSQDDIKVDMAKEAASGGIVDELKSFESTLSNLLGEQVTLSSDYEDRYMAAVADIYVKELTVSDTTQKTQVYTGNMLDKARNGENGLTAEIIKAGDPLDIDQKTGKDVAILKVSGSNLPSVHLGDDSNVRNGDKVLGLGYLTDQTGSSSDNFPSENKPTLATGTVSGHRTMDGGWDIIQMQIPLEQGSSGSPILDSNGDAIGVMVLVTTTNADETGAQTSVATEKYAVPMSVVKDYMSQVNVTASDGTANKTYREGVDLFYEQHYSAAKDKFTDVKNINPDFPFIQDSISESQANIDKGLDQGTFPWMIVIVGHHHRRHYRRSGRADAGCGHAEIEEEERSGRPGNPTALDAC